MSIYVFDVVTVVVVVVVVGVVRFSSSVGRYVCSDTEASRPRNRFPFYNRPTMIVERKYIYIYNSLYTTSRRRTVIIVGPGRLLRQATVAAAAAAVAAVAAATVQGVTVTRMPKNEGDRLGWVAVDVVVVVAVVVGRACSPSRYSSRDFRLFRVGIPEKETPPRSRTAQKRRHVV